MPGETIVFLGPTLDSRRASAHFDAVYLPPADQGAVYRAARALNPNSIVLIDGSFAKVPAVRHKEILWALSIGIPVYGASSMGALRAAELAAFGMKGHGLIYRWYSLTPFADDDEVAVAMTPVELGSRPLSDALINMRLTLRRGERRGVIPREMRQALEDLARSIHFVERTYSTLFERARAGLVRKWAILIDDIERWVTGNAVDQKEIDAISLLQCLAAASKSHRGEIRRHAHERPFRLTEAWVADLDAAGLEIDHLLTGC